MRPRGDPSLTRNAAVKFQKNRRKTATEKMPKQKRSVRAAQANGRMNGQRPKDEDTKQGAADGEDSDGSVDDPDLMSFANDAIEPEDCEQVEVVAIESDGDVEEAMDSDRLHSVAEELRPWLEKFQQAPNTRRVYAVGKTQHSNRSARDRDIKEQKARKGIAQMPGQRSMTDFLVAEDTDDELEVDFGVPDAQKEDLYTTERMEQAVFLLKDLADINKNKQKDEKWIKSGRSVFLKW